MHAASPEARGAAGVPPRARAGLVAGLALILATPLALHLSAVGAPFFADDYLFLDQVRGRSLFAVLADPDPIGNFVRPVGRQLWFWGVTNAFGESPAAFHALGLAAFVAILALFHALSRALAGARAAVLATGFLAAHYASDVPVRWAVGSQDLLAVLGAVGALFLHVRGRSLLASVALLAGLLSKETVLFTPLIAIAAGRREGEPWTSAARRAWPLFAAVAAWAALWIARTPHPLAPSTGVALDPAGALAAIAHLAQVTVGWEARPGHPMSLDLDPAALVAPVLVTIGAALALPRLRPARGTPAAGHSARGTEEATPVEESAARTESERAPAKSSRAPTRSSSRGVAIGVAWALLATAPIAAVASIWSAYYYLFAMGGVALAFGALASRWAVPGALAALWVLALGSAAGRSLDEFALARAPWTGQSHLNRFYIDRASRESARYLATLMRSRRDFPPGTTVYFAGLPNSIAFQTADGPLLRWAYRDPTLRSYYMNQFTRERAAGPVFLFYVSGDSLVQAKQGTDTFGRIAYGLTLNDRLAAARQALAILRERGGSVPGVGYYEAWLAWATGDTAGARSLLEREGMRLAPGPAPEREYALAALAAGDTAQAITALRSAVALHARDPRAHATLADLALMTDPAGLEAAVETVAARALAPEDPYAWRRFAMLQIARERHPEALATLDRYFALAGAAGREDAEAHRWVDELRRRTPAGDVVQGARRK